MEKNRIQKTNPSQILAIIPFVPLILIERILDIKFHQKKKDAEIPNHAINNRNISFKKTKISNG